MSTGTYFYNRTIYRRIGMPVPDCFLELDRHFASMGVGMDRMFVYPMPILGLSENLCRRMGDVDFYAKSIEDSLGDGTGAYGQAPVVGTLLVGYFSACKSVLDAVALAVNELFALNRRGGNCDLHKEGFWNALRTANRTAFDCYAPFRPLVNSIVDWRDSAIHRVTPLTMASGEGAPQEVPLRSISVKMCLIPDVGYQDFYQLVQHGNAHDRLGHPLHFHRLWRERLVEMCELVCRDIAAFHSSTSQR